MAYEIWLGTSVVTGLISAFIAHRKGKDPVVWFFIGALFNVVVFFMVAQIKRRTS
jgi:hypothetical protein